MACSGVSSFPARFDVTQGRPPHRSRPRPARAIPQRSPPAPPAAQASGQACNLPGLWTSLCLLRDRSRSRERHAGSRNPALARRIAPARQPRLGLPGLQPAKRLAATHRILRPVSGGRAELYAVCASGAPPVEARGEEGGESVLRAGGVSTGTDDEGRKLEGRAKLSSARPSRFFPLPTVTPLPPHISRLAGASSRASITRFRSTPHAYPPSSPLARITRWHGIR